MTRATVGHSHFLHDAAIAVLMGEEIFAEAVERHTQCKFAEYMIGLPYTGRALGRFLRARELPTPTELVVRASWDFKNAAPAFRGMIGSLMDGIETLEPAQIAMMLSAADERGGPFWEIFQTTKIDVQPTSHHLSHAALAAYSSPFEESVVFVLDGTGEVGGCSWYRFENGKLTPLSISEQFGGSLGQHYGTITKLCGFYNEGEEWKVMGLASYGERDPKVFDFFRSRTVVEGLDIKIAIDTVDLSWTEELAKLTGPFRRPAEPPERSAVLARSFQDYFEDVVLEVTTKARRLGLSSNLTYAGGCALNSTANGKIVSASGFSNVHVVSAPGDDGTALGAALYHRHDVEGVPYQPRTLSPYLGSEIPEEDVLHILSFGGVDYERMPSDEALCAHVAERLASGAIVAWCQGRAEFGPRALGNRSILADPRDPEMGGKINSRVKFRERFRPLAPSILHDHGRAYFERYEDSPYMERTLPFRDDVKAKVPAVVHVDGTGRVQSVTRDRNPLYHALLSAFHERTGVPILLNTSFNVMGKPIVHSAADAITVFFTSGLDLLVLGRYAIRKKR